MGRLKVRKQRRKQRRCDEDRTGVAVEDEPNIS